MDLVLFEPRIPPNTGSIARLCAATDTTLHLIEPLGFSLEEKHLRRAGLDYWPHVRLRVWPGWSAFLVERSASQRLLMTSVRGTVSYHRFRFEAQDVLVFGPETMGLPLTVLEQADHVLRLPMMTNVRSLNLANAAAILLYEGLRQTGKLDQFDRPEAG